MLKRILGALAVGAMFMPASTGGVHGDVPEKVFTYTIVHPKHGDIGTFTNRILDDGKQIAVNNEIEVQVKVLLIVAHSETSKNEEIWKDGRLVSFSGVTKENGKETIVTGEADGPRFVVEAPDGQKEAPAGVFPNNPWSKAILKAKVLLGTKSGKLYNVHAATAEARDIKLGDRTVTTEYVRVGGDAQYELWFDKRGVAVKFAEIAEHGLITFRLVDESVRPASAAGEPSRTSG